MHFCYQRSFILLFFLLGGLVPFQIQSQVHDFHSVTAFGFNPVARYNSSLTKPVFLLSQEFYAGSDGRIQAGAGVKYLFPGDITDDEQLSWLPLYASVKVNISQSTFPVYVKGSAGYTFVLGNSPFMEEKENLRGGFYYFLGGGTNLPFYYSDVMRFSFIFDMGYSFYTGEVEDRGILQSLSFQTLEISAGIGIKL